MATSSWSTLQQGAVLAAWQWNGVKKAGSPNGSRIMPMVYHVYLFYIYIYIFIIMIIMIMIIIMMIIIMMIITMILLCIMHIYLAYTYISTRHSIIITYYLHIMYTSYIIYIHTHNPAVSHHFPIFSWPVKAVGAGYVRLFNAELQQLIAVRGTQAIY